MIIKFALFYDDSPLQAPKNELMKDFPVSKDLLIPLFSGLQFLKTKSFQPTNFVEKSVYLTASSRHSAIDLTTRKFAKHIHTSPIHLL